LSLYLDDGRLYLHQRGSLPIELWPEGEDRFFRLFHEGNGLTVAFERDDRGAVVVATGRLLGEWFRLERVEGLPTVGAPSPLIPWWGWALLAAGTAGAVAVAVAARRRAGMRGRRPAGEA